MEKKEVLVVLVLFLVVVLFTFYYQNFIELGNNVCIGENCFETEIVDTPEGRTKGLMNREELGRYNGMIFIWEEEGVYPFWMKNTKIDLDMIWINNDKEIVFIQRNAVPCESEVCKIYNPEKNAKYVLEINGGLSQEFGIEIGDFVDFDF